MTLTASLPRHGGDTCARCGIPADALPFDVAATVDWQRAGREIVLARFDLPPQYCGVLTSFHQFTSEHAADPSRIATPTIRWQLLIDRHPAAPWADLQLILNPWGSSTPHVVSRLSSGARVELVARRAGPDTIATIAGRLTGHYWYDSSYGALLDGHRV